MDVLTDKVLGLLESKFGQRPSLDDPLAFIGVDSISMAELTVEIEKIFGIRVEDDVVQIETVGELVAYIQQRVDGGAPDPSPSD